MPHDISRRIRGLLPWVLLTVIIAAGAFVRVRLIDVPLERDEGEYALSGQLMLRGVPPYAEAWNMKFPGTYAAYALIMLVFGESIRGIHTGLLLVNAVCTLLLYLLALRFLDWRAALTAAGTFTLLSDGWNVLGLSGHATHFVILFAMAGALLLLKALDNDSASRLFAAGLCFGTAVLMKQHGVLFGFFGAGWILWADLKAAPRRIAAYAGGCAAPIALTFFLIWRMGAFPKFWFWTIQYAREYAAENSLADGWDIFKDTFPYIFVPNAALWILAALGLALIWLRKDRMRTALPATLALLVSLLAVCPGLYFRDHYFILILPAVALLAGAAVSEGMARWPALPVLCVWVLAEAGAVYYQREFLFRMTPFEASRYQYSTNPFPEAIRAAAFIRAHTSAGTRIAVIGSEPEIYFYAGRRPATGFMYTYALMEDQPFALVMQDEMIREIEDAKPMYVVMVTNYLSWTPDDDSNLHIFEWWKQYRSHYTRVGVADTFSEIRTDYRWGDEAAADPPHAESSLEIYRLNP